MRNLVLDVVADLHLLKDELYIRDLLSYMRENLVASRILAELLSKLGHLLYADVALVLKPVGVKGLTQDYSFRGCFPLFIRAPQSGQYLDRPYLSVVSKPHSLHVNS